MLSISRVGFVNRIFTVPNKSIGFVVTNNLVYIFYTVADIYVCSEKYVIMYTAFIMTSELFNLYNNRVSISTGKLSAITFDRCWTTLVMLIFWLIRTQHCAVERCIKSIEMFRVLYFCKQYMQYNIHALLYKLYSKIISKYLQRIKELV